MTRSHNIAVEHTLSEQSKANLDLPDSPKEIQEAVEVRTAHDRLRKILQTRALWCVGMSPLHGEFSYSKKYDGTDDTEPTDQEIIRAAERVALYTLPLDTTIGFIDGLVVDDRATATPATLESARLIAEAAVATHDTATYALAAFSLAQDSVDPEMSVNIRERLELAFADTSQSTDAVAPSLRETVTKRRIARSDKFDALETDSVSHQKDDRLKAYSPEQLDTLAKEDDAILYEKTDKRSLQNTLHDSVMVLRGKRSDRTTAEIIGEAVHEDIEAVGASILPKAEVDRMIEDRIMSPAIKDSLDETDYSPATPRAALLVAEAVQELEKIEDDKIKDAKIILDAIVGKLPPEQQVRCSEVINRAREKGTDPLKLAQRVDASLLAA